MSKLLGHLSLTSATSGSKFRPSWKRGVIYVAVLSIACLISPSVLADSHIDLDLGGEGYGEGALLASLEAANITIAFLATMLFIGVARRLGSSRDGVGVGYIACGIALLGMTRVFYIVADRGVIFVHDDTLEFWWHIIFFNAMALCIFGGKVLDTVEDDVDWLGSLRSLKLWSVVSALVTVAAFLTAEPMDKSFVAAFDGTPWDALGVQHFAGFVTAAFASLHIACASGSGIITRLKLPILTTYSLFALDHFWELLFESWEIFAFEETLIERVEQMIVLPALLAALYAGWKLWELRSEAKQASAAGVQS